MTEVNLALEFCDVVAVPWHIVNSHKFIDLDCEWETSTKKNNMVHFHS